MYLEPRKYDHLLGEGSVAILKGPDAAWQLSTPSCRGAVSAAATSDASYAAECLGILTTIEYQ